MRRESHVRFCERLAVRLRRATHRNVYVRSEKAGHRVMASLTRFIEGRLKLQVPVSTRPASPTRATG